MFQVAYGYLGLSRDTFLDMSLKEFFNAWLGKQEADRNEFEMQRNLHWSLMQQQSIWLAQTNKQAKSIANQQPQWSKKTKREPLDYDKMKGAFMSISRDVKDGK